MEILHAPSCDKTKQKTKLPGDLQKDGRRIIVPFPVRPTVSTKTWGTPKSPNK
jgi:hypothetical protein